jgi:integrase
MTDRKRRPKGEGSITQRHDHRSCPQLIDGTRADHRCQGRWTATVDLGWAGKRRIRKTLYGATQKEVQIKLKTAMRERDTGALVATSPTVEKWLRYWLDVICVERGLKVNTMKSHRSKVERYLIPHLGRHRVDKLQPEHVRALYAAMREKGLAEATVRQTHAILRRALEVAVREGKASRNVAGIIDPPKVKRNLRHGLTVADARRVLKVSGLRWHVALYMGLRQSEALGLRWSDVNIDDGWLAVEQTLVRKPGVGLIFDTPKSDASNRFVPIPPVVQAHFKLAWLEHTAAGGGIDELVFRDERGGPVDHRADWKAWRNTLDLASVPPLAPVPQIALHAARNTTASLLEAAGIPVRMVAEILGQSTVAVTHGYQLSDMGRRREAMLALESYVAEPGG